MPLRSISLIIQSFYLTGAIALLIVVAGRRTPSDGPALTLAAIVMLGVVGNAVVHGVAAGVFDRYQGRVAWLIPLLVLCILLRRRAGLPSEATTTRPAAP